MILRWLRTIVLAVLGLIFLFAYSFSYVNVLVRPSQAILRSDFVPLILLLVNVLPFLAGLLFGLAAFNGPIRGVKFSVLNFLAIAFVPMLFGCGLPTLASVTRMLEPLRDFARLPLFREPSLLQLQPMMALVAGVGLGVAFTRGFKDADSPAPIASSPSASEE